MAKLTVFNFLSANGFYKGANGDISWTQHNAEESEFSSDSMQAGNTLLFGRVTYQMMTGFWPSPMALERAPKEAEGINKAEKIVFSNTLKTAGWNNTRIISGDIIEQVKQLKETSANNLTILGSGNIITQFAGAGIIDEYQFMIYPVAIGQGEPLFKGISQNLNLKLVSSRVFKSGTVLVNYAV